MATPVTSGASGARPRLVWRSTPVALMTRRRGRSESVRPGQGIREWVGVVGARHQCGPGGVDGVTSERHDECIREVARVQRPADVRGECVD